MNNKAKIAATVLLAFGVAACGESQYDKDRKGALVDSIVTNSMENCAVVEPSNHDLSYDQRLRVVLMDADSEALDVVLAKDVTVCLDARLSEQVNGTFDSRIDGVYYDGKKPVVTLWDNGMAGSGAKFLKQDTSDYGYDIINRFAEFMEDGDFHLSDRFAFSSQQSCGKDCIREYWDNRSDFDKDSIRKNPDLLTPPLKAAP